MLSNKQFFDDLAADYGGMINFENSLKNKITSLKRFIKPSYKYALDFGCGTGADSIALAKLGLSVNAVDQSTEMIKIAEENAKKHKTTINFYTSSILEARVITRLNEHDIIVSLGNTLANINGLELKRTIRWLTTNLASKGSMVFQIVNYAAIPNSGEYILNTSETDELLITRKYIFNRNDIDFVIERENKIENKVSIIRTKIFPHSKDLFDKVAKENNLSVGYFGSLIMENYSESLSKDLIILLEN